MAPKIRLIKGHVYDFGNGEVMIHGQVDSESLRAIQPPDYQREVLQGTAKFEQLKAAHRAGKRVPDVTLNMRGKRFEQLGNGVIELISDVFMVDGQQRIASAIQVMNEDEAIAPAIAAVITVGMSEEWERDQFDILNNLRTQVSSNITLRNYGSSSLALASLFRLTLNSEFPLNRRVQWEQTMHKGETTTATVFVKTVGRLHGHFGPGRASNVLELSRGIDEIFDLIGRNTLIGNVKVFFGLIDECWGLSEAQRGATVLKQGFLLRLADVFAELPDFWVQYHLVIPATFRTKLKVGIKPDDPAISDLASNNSRMGTKVFNKTIVEVLSKSRRTPLATWADVEPDNGENGEE